MWEPHLAVFEQSRHHLHIEVGHDDFGQTLLSESSAERVLDIGDESEPCVQSPRDRARDAA